MSESIYDSICLNCGTKNYFSNGDETDLTTTDVEAVKCFKCNKEYPVEGFGDIYDEPFEYCLEEYGLNIADGFARISIQG